jgi:L-fuculose-phosphate aldolase
MTDIFVDEAQARRALVRLGRELYAQGMMAGSTGNLSVRLGADRVLITRSGAHKGRLRSDDLLVIDLDGQLLTGTGHPSTETPMHLAIYRRHPWAGAVVHAHPPKATALAAAHRPIPLDTLPEGLFALGDLPHVPYRPSKDPAYGEAVAQALDGADGALLLNHGAVTVGRDLAQAGAKMEILEALAAVAADHLAMGVAGVPLPAAEIERIRAIWRNRRQG